MAANELRNNLPTFYCISGNTFRFLLHVHVNLTLKDMSFFMLSPIYSFCKVVPNVLLACPMVSRILQCNHGNKLMILTTGQDNVHYVDCILTLFRPWDFNVKFVKRLNCVFKFQQCFC